MGFRLYSWRHFDRLYLMTSRHYSIFGLAGPLIFWCAYFVMAGLRPEYSFLTKAVSELGSTDAPNKWCWNILGYIVPGLLISVYSYGLFKSLSNEQGNKLPLIGMVFSGLLMAFSGVFPGDFENKRSTTMLLHTIGSFGSYIFFLMGAFTYPSLMRKSGYWAKSIKPTLTFTWLTILFGAWPFVFPNTPAVGQRLVFFFFFAWIFYTAWRLYKKPNSI